MWSNHRRPLYLVLLAGLVSFSLAACSPSSQSSHVTTIGIINYLAGFEPVITGLKANLKDAGFVEGQSIVYVYDGVVANNNDAIDQEIQKVASHNPDVYLTLGTSPSQRIQDILQKSNKYAVFAPVTNPDKVGLVQDLTKPGGRLTGITIGGPLTSKSLEWFLTVVPSVKRVHVFYLHGETLAPPQFPALQAVVDKVHVQLVLHDVSAPADIVPIMASFSSGSDGIFLIPTQLSFAPHALDYVQTAVQQGIAVGSSSVGAIPNVLTGVNIDYIQIGKQAGQMVQQIIHGADAGTLPVEPAQFALQLNMVTAHSLGLTIPDSVLGQADTVIRVNPTPVPTAVPPPSTAAATSSKAQS